MLRLKRVYEPPSPDDGCRVLVDRLWPRGVSKESAALDAWFKEVGPSQELRQWFGHDPAKFGEFAARYKRELASNQAVAELRAIIAKHPDVTLLYGAHDQLHNQAVVLKEFLGL